MAQLDISSIEKVNKERNTLHEKVETKYSVFEYDNNVYVQFDTYGRDRRKFPEKISQSIQFDKETAKFLVDLLSKEFNL